MLRRCATRNIRAKKFFVGSGVVEAGCRPVIGERLKQSSMRRSVCGAGVFLHVKGNQEHQYKKTGLSGQRVTKKPGEFSNLVHL